MTLTLTFDVTTILTVSAMVLSIAYVITYYTYQMRYTKYKSVKSGEKKDNAYSLHSSDHQSEEPSDPRAFLSTFLSSVKIFGYLENEVFQELAKHLQEVKVQRGQNILDLDSSDRSFYAVVDGCIQVYIKSKVYDSTENLAAVDPLTRPESFYGDDLDDSFHLLNEVKNGGVVSSLFNILSLFTEVDEELQQKALTIVKPGGPSIQVHGFSSNPVFPGLIDHNLRETTNIAARTVNRAGGILAKASRDSTLIAIPEIAFKTLAAKFPKAAAHIIQVILARFQRVTSLALSKYLGLSKELIKIEKHLVESSISTISLDLIQSVLKEYERPFGLTSPRGGSNRILNRTHSRSHSVKPVIAIQETIKPMIPESFSEELESTFQNKLIPVVMSCRDPLTSVKLKEELFKCVLKTLGLKPSEDQNQLLSRSASFVRLNDLKAENAKNLNGNSLIDSAINMDRNVDIMYASAQSVLIESGQKDCGLYLIIHGTAEISFQASTRDRNSKSAKGYSFYVQTGGLVGYLSVMSGYPSLFRVTSYSDCCVMHIKRSYIERLIEQNSETIITLGKRLFQNLSPLVRHVDFALDWMTLKSGQVLWDEKTYADGIYLILHGRLRCIKKNGFEAISEHGQGESVGETEVLLETERAYTVHAIRNTELVRVPRTLLYTLAMKYPEITIEISKVIATKSQRLSARQIGPKMMNHNVKTIGILPVNSNVPLAEFSESLHRHIRALCTCKLLDQSAVMDGLGRQAFKSLGKLKLMSWLADQEEDYDIVLYTADSASSLWTQHCIGQADCILIVGTAKSNPAIGDYERLLISMNTTARKELVLLHDDIAVSAGSTATWLQNRVWINNHHHIIMCTSHKGSQNAQPKHRNLPIPFLMKQEPLSKSSLFERSRKDFSRLARILTGQAIGLVLGGGGAKGFAHIGVIKALEEAAIPIDLVGGCSMGAFIGGLYAKDTDSVSIYGRAKQLAIKLDSKWRILMDLTYPVTSWFNGHGFNRAIWKIFADIRIEDLWLDYFSVTTNISESKLEIHKEGYIWRYVRASMSLSGYFPPLCDQGRMLLDGGYLNNLPVDIMAQQGVKYVIAVDVARQDSTEPVAYGDSVSGWVLLLQSMLRIKSQVPTLAEIQSRLAYVSSVGKLQEAKSMSSCVYVKPPLQEYNVTSFGQFKEIVQVGYDFGKEKVLEWEKSGLLAKLRSRNTAIGGQSPEEMPSLRRKSI